MLKCIELDEKLKSMDQEITVNPQFVQKVRSNLLQSTKTILDCVKIMRSVFECSCMSQNLPRNNHILGVWFSIVDPKCFKTMGCL